MFWDVLIGLMVIGTLVWTVLAVLVVRKAGYTGWQGGLFLVPVANIAFFVWFALTEWPIQRELNFLQTHDAEQNNTRR